MNLLSLVLGILISSIGLMFIFLYLNLFALGYNFWEYVHFISTRLECLLFFLGIIIIMFSLKGWIKSVLLLRPSSKFSR